MNVKNINQIYKIKFNKKKYIFRKVSVYNYTNCMWPMFYYYDTIITHIRHALLACIRTFLYYICIYLCRSFEIKLLSIAGPELGQLLSHLFYYFIWIDILLNCCSDFFELVFNFEQIFFETFSWYLLTRK